MEILKMEEQHRESVLEMMRVFYRSPAVHTDGSEEIFRADVDSCIRENPYLEGYVLTDGGQLLGYAMVAKSFSTEFGKPCLWLEDLYLLEQARGRGWGQHFLRFLQQKYPEVVIRLEVEEENGPAVHAYRKSGFREMPYLEMIWGTD